MHARSAVIEVPVDQVDGAVQSWVDDTMPKYRAQPGYRGFTLLVDRQNGKALGVSFWEDGAALDASHALGAQARKDLAEGAGGGEQPYSTWEVALHEDA